MTYDASSYRCVDCTAFITVKEFVEHLAERKGNGAAHINCEYAYNKPSLKYLLEKYDELVRERYILGGYYQGHGVGKVAPLQERHAIEVKIKRLRKLILKDE